MHKQCEKTGLAVFPTELGWMAVMGRGAALWRLSFGHDSPRAARNALEAVADIALCDDGWNRPLVERLTAYASGDFDDFRDVTIQTGKQTDFQRLVTHYCRSIPYGETATYGQLAALAGRPRAARAVGNVMGANRVPLVVPCHRVVASGGGLGGYSAGEGTRLKLRLLEIESPAVVA